MGLKASSPGELTLCLPRLMCKVQTISVAYWALGSAFLFFEFKNSPPSLRLTLTR